MTFASITRCIIFILALGCAESNRRRGLSLDGDKKVIMMEAPTKQSGHISLVNMKDISTGDLKIYREPPTHLKKENIIIETNKKTEKQKDFQPTESKLRMKLSNKMEEGDPPSKDLQTRLGRVQHQTHAKNPHLRQRRTTQRCNGIKKIVQCNDGVAEEICKKVLIDAGVELLSNMPNTQFFAICVGSEEEAQLVADLTEMAGVEDDPVRTLSVIPGSKVVRKLQSNEQVIPYGVDLVNAPAFWDRYGKRGSGVTVCVIDTGIRSTHEDLQNADLSGSNDSFLVTPWNQDGNGHGTHVSGTILATDNGVGVIGVAPEASIHFVRVFDESGEFTASSLVDAMNACASAGAKIISMSLGGPLETSAERTTVANLKDSGILLVAASGNDAGGNNYLEFPAGYEAVMSVAAIDENLDIATFSSYNFEVDIAAPGVDVLSTFADSDTGYAKLSGTSMATPHVAGVAALLWSQFPDKSVTDIDNAIKLSARDFGACGQDNLFGHGIVDVMAAATYLESGGGGAPEQSNCIDISVSLTTDDYGSETYYFITPRDDANNIVYRGGPYPDSQRSTYTDAIKVQGGCYDLILLDTIGDGSNDPNFGIGGISVTYQGNKEVDFNDFGGSQEVFRFGNCDGGTNPTTPSPTTSPVESPTIPTTPSPTTSPVESPTIPTTPSPTTSPVESPTIPTTPSPTNSPVESPTSPPVNAPTAPVTPPIEAPETPPGDYECGTGEAQIQMDLETDAWSGSENQLLFWDVAAPENEWVWLVNLSEFEPNRVYEGNACLLLSQCYQFYFFDAYGDGLATGGLTLTLDGQEVFQISAGDIGSVYEEGLPVRYWTKQFGDCSSTSTNSINFNN